MIRYPYQRRNIKTKEGTVMKIRKTYLVTGVIGLAFVVVIGSGLLASATAGRFCDWDSPMGHRFGAFHRGMPPADVAEVVLARIDGRVSALQLTEPQKARYQELRARLKVHIEAQVTEQKALKEQIRTEINRGTPDPLVVSELVKKRIRSLSAALEEGPDIFAEFYSILDDNQKALVLARFRERMEKSPRWR
jgi:hypothetical protein